MQAELSNEELILSFLAEGGDDFTSGAALSDKLGLSRTAVWKHVETLRRLGYRIDAHPVARLPADRDARPAHRARALAAARHQGPRPHPPLRRDARARPTRAPSSWPRRAPSTARWSSPRSRRRAGAAAAASWVVPAGQEPLLLGHPPPRAAAAARARAHPGGRGGAGRDAARGGRRGLHQVAQRRAGRRQEGGRHPHRAVGRHRAGALRGGGGGREPQHRARRLPRRAARDRHLADAWPAARRCPARSSPPPCGPSSRSGSTATPPRASPRCARRGSSCPPPSATTCWCAPRRASCAASPRTSTRAARCWCAPRRQAREGARRRRGATARPARVNREGEESRP